MTTNDEPLVSVRDLDAPHGWHSFGGTVVTRVGKNKSGRLLDGVEHNARPT